MKPDYQLISDAENLIPKANVDNSQIIQICLRSYLGACKDDNNLDMNVYAYYLRQYISEAKRILAAQAMKDM